MTIRATLVPLGAVLLALAAPSASRADPALAGSRLVVASHGQPFCADPAALRALLRASVAEAPGLPNGCAVLPENATVEVVSDLDGGTPVMHIVKARAVELFGAIEGYTYSVGLYPPVLGEGPPPLPYR